MTSSSASPVIIEIALNARAAPEWVQLLPKGPQIRGRDGRAWRLDDPEDFAVAFNGQGLAVALDWEHATQIKGARGERADAAGWIEELEARGGEVWGRVSWTEEGRNSIGSRGYRYLSPTFDYAPGDGHIRRLVSAGLVHDPNLSLAALNHRADPHHDPHHRKDPAMDQAITEALGLTSGASSAQIREAIDRLKGDLATATNRAEKPDPTAFVPRADYDLAMNRLEGFETAAREAREAEITDTVDRVIAAGDPAYPPAARDDLLAMCRAEGGLERFRRLARPQLERALNRASITGDPPAGKTAALTDEERAVCRQLGMTETDYLAEKNRKEA